MTARARDRVLPSWFAGRMEALGPFEESPWIATACSGGPDSMALALLADRWALTRGGRSTALVVDHGMRQDSAQEASTVRDRLAAAGVDAVILTRLGPPATADRQAAARRARYTLMQDWCRNAGVLHLLLGHHKQDQAETLLLRLARGSGVDGLAAMSPVTEIADVRLLRPLLDTSAKQLIAFLNSEGCAYVKDPSNADPAYARVRMRGLLPSLEGEGLTVSRLCDTARRMARARAALDGAATALLARIASIYPEGYATVTPGPLCDAPDEVALRVLSRLLACIGGGEYGPRLAHLERLHAWLRGPDTAGRGRTLAGCQVLRRRGGILICRESAGAGQPIAAADGAVWDNRFKVSMDEEVSDHMQVGCLGPEGWRKLVGERPGYKKFPLPAQVRLALPAIRELDELVAVPHLNYRRDTEDKMDLPWVEVTFGPARPLSAARFASAADFP